MWRSRRISWRDAGWKKLHRIDLRWTSIRYCVCRHKGVWAQMHYCMSSCRQGGSLNRGALVAPVVPQDNLTGVRPAHNQVGVKLCKPGWHHLWLEKGNDTIEMCVSVLTFGFKKHKTIYLKAQCVGFRGDLQAEMEYNIQNYVFISVWSPEKNIIIFLYLEWADPLPLSLPCCIVYFCSSPEQTNQTRGVFTSL